MLATLLFVCIFPIMILVVSLGISEERKGNGKESGEQEAFVETAYGSGSMEIEDNIKGIFGEAVQYGITFHAVKGVQGQESDENRIICYAYHSDRDWILERIYSLYIDEREDITEENLWESMEMKQSSQKTETAVRFQDRVLYMRSREKLDKAQILFLRQVLDL